MNQQFCSLTLSVDLIELQLSLRYQSSDEERWEVGAIWRQEWIHFTKLFNIWNNEYSWKLVPPNWGLRRSPWPEGQTWWFINWLQFLGYQLVIQWRRTMFILTWWQCGRAPTDCPLEQGPASSRVESENQARPGGCCDLTRVCLFGSAWVRMMFPPPPPSPQLYNVDTTHHNKLPMSSTWRKYW